MAPRVRRPPPGVPAPFPTSVHLKPSRTSSKAQPRAGPEPSSPRSQHFSLVCTATLPRDPAWELARLAIQSCVTSFGRCGHTTPPSRHCGGKCTTVRGTVSADEYMRLPSPSSAFSGSAVGSGLLPQRGASLQSTCRLLLTHVPKVRCQAPLAYSKTLQRFPTGQGIKHTSPPTSLA